MWSCWISSFDLTARMVRIHVARLIADLNDRASESLDAAFAGCGRRSLAQSGLDRTSAILGRAFGSAASGSHP
jgi:hypothetical protein